MERRNADGELAAEVGDGQVGLGIGIAADTVGEFLEAVHRLEPR
jgi:hypothetical protein